MRVSVAIALLVASGLGCSSTSAGPPLVASGGTAGYAGESSPELPPCNTTVDAGAELGAFIAAAIDGSPQGTTNPTTPTFGDGSLALVDAATATADAGVPCR